MSPRHAAFAIPGDITTLTGGYIYERRLLEGLRQIGHDVQHIELAAAFPDPSPSEMAAALAALGAVSESRALILDGLILGSIETTGLAQVRAPLVGMIHHPLALETGLPRDRRDHLFRTERDNLKLAARVLVPSAHTRDLLVADYGVAPEVVTIAPPGTDQRVRQNAPSSPTLILSVGIQHARKGHDVLLKALARLDAPEWRAVIVGSPHDRDNARDLQQLLGRLDLGDRVTLAGKLPQAELDALYAQASIFALATRYEGYGMVFDEALSWGLPIVSCNTGAVPHTVPGDAGLLVPVDDPEALSQALSLMLSDPAARERFASAAKVAGQTLPSWQETARSAGRVLDGLAP